VFLCSAAGLSQAQSLENHDTWLRQNYRFTGPPAPGTVKPVDPVLSKLNQLQSVLRALMWKAKSEGDYESALAAAAHAAANAQLIGAYLETAHPPQPLPPLAPTTTPPAIPDQSGYAPGRDPEAAAAQPTSDPRGYLLALKDHTIVLASSYWADKYMFHYMSQGAHVQVRGDLIDQNLSQELNRQRGVELALPEFRAGQ
jgi:hypothetical protein